MIRDDIDSDQPLYVGSDNPMRAYVTEGAAIRLAAAAALSATSLQVEPLAEALTTGAKLRFRFSRKGPGLVVTVSADAAVGAQTVAVGVLDGHLPVRTLGRLIRNISTDTLEYVLRDGATGTMLVTKNNAAITKVDAANGVCEWLIEDSDTFNEGTGAILVQPGRYIDTLRKTDAGDERPLLVGAVVVALPAAR